MNTWRSGSCTAALRQLKVRNCKQNQLLSIQKPRTTARVCGCFIREILRNSTHNRTAWAALGLAGLPLLRRPLSQVDSSGADGVRGLEAGDFVTSLQGRGKGGPDQAGQLAQVNVHALGQALGNSISKSDVVTCFLRQVGHDLFNDPQALFWLRGRHGEDFKGSLQETDHSVR